MTSSGSLSPEPLLTIQHTTGSYPVFLSSGSHRQVVEHARRFLPGRSLVVVFDQSVDRYAPSDAIHRMAVPSGEGSKNRSEWSRISDHLIAEGFGRDTGLIALGGGVIGDLVGFVAATYHRGIPYLQVPTTLLAMIDASIGGKTAIDTPAGKNLIGAFHPPAAVIIDPTTLATLPDAHLRAGLAEAIKHGCIRDRTYLEEIEQDLEDIGQRDLPALERLIEGSLRIKASIVEADERESGLRAVLNAGHTLGHAIEALSRWTLLHGEAVSIGLALETDLAEHLGIAEAGSALHLRRILQRAGLPTALPPTLNDPGRLLDLMERDKKNRGREIRFSFIRSIGTAAEGDNGEMTQVVSRERILEFLSGLV